MKEYINLFIDKDYPTFLDKYFNTKTLKRLKYITQFCGADYTKIYSPLFLYTRFDHSKVVAYMTWHFTHDKKETIVALLHDAGTPCFAHCIDYVLGDYINQESGERSIVDIIKKDEEIQTFLKEDGVTLNDLNNFSNFKILENKSPKLCADRLDGVLHTVYIWLHTHSLEKIKEVYNNITVLQNEENQPEIGFKNIISAEKFADMVYNYATELQGNRDKYVMKYISEVIKLAFSKKLINLEDLYTKGEKEICDIISSNFSSWKEFASANKIVGEENSPKENFYVSFATKKRNVIPLVHTIEGDKRITEVSNYAKQTYKNIEEYEDSKYAYVKTIKKI